MEGKFKMRNISFFLTVPQFMDGSKDVTRRLGWRDVSVGDRLMACEKCQGLKPGEQLNKLGEIEVVHVSRQPLDNMLGGSVSWGMEEASREGFPEMTAREFVDFFCKSMKCESSDVVTRIEYVRVVS